jgi:hypothetical protein
VPVQGQKGRTLGGGRGDSKEKAAVVVQVGRSLVVSASHCQRAGSEPYCWCVVRGY